MQLLDDHLLLSASDLINFLECEHLTALDSEKAYRRLDAKPKRPDSAELVSRKGDEHEQRHLELLRSRHGDGLVEIDDGVDGYRGLVNIRQRGANEPHRDHISAFGFNVEDLEGTHRRAVAAGAQQHFAPMDEEGLPRHSRFEDPSGNRIVLWQA